LDGSLRDELRSQLRRWLVDFGIPVVLVTHDRTEAMALGDHIVVMDQGRVRQSGTIADVFSRPSDQNVARIVGMETIVAGEVVSIDHGLALVDVEGVKLLAVACDAGVQYVHLCLKAEDVFLLRQPAPHTSVRNQFLAAVKWLSPEGPLVRVGLSIGFDLSALITRPAYEELQLRVGDQINIAVKASSLHLIPRHDGN
jgi:molybdate transport system ATP-binding protein